MTEEQKRLAEDNHELIFGYMRKYRLDEESYGILALSLCQAAQTYDNEKAAFSTYAYSSMRLNMQRDWRKEKAQRRGGGQMVLSLDYGYKGSEKECNLNNVVGEETDMETKLIEKEIIKEAIVFLREKLSEEDLEIFAMYLEGMKQREIGAKCGKTSAAVSKKILNTKALLRTQFRRRLEK